MTVPVGRRESFNAGHNYVLEAVVAGAVSVRALSRTRVTARVKRPGKSPARRARTVHDREGVHAASGPLPNSEEGTA